MADYPEPGSAMDPEDHPAYNIPDASDPLWGHIHDAPTGNEMLEDSANRNKSRREKDSISLGRARDRSNKAGEESPN